MLDDVDRLKEQTDAAVQKARLLVENLRNVQELENKLRERERKDTDHQE